MNLVYLGGSITTNPKHSEWRTYVADALIEDGIGTISPIRGKTAIDCIKQTDPQTNVFDNGNFVMRDYHDIERCDVLFLAFMEDWKPDRQSIGTWAEFGFAKCSGIPIVVVSDMPEVVKHPFIWKDSNVFENLAKGIEYTKWLLMPGVE